MENKNFKKPSPLRRRYLINRPLQLAHSGFIAWAMGIGMIIAWLVTYYTIWSLVLNQVARDVQLPQILRDVNSRLFWTLVIPGFILLVLVALLQVFLSHRIAGPAYRLRKTISEMNRDLWPEKINVRNYDFLKDVIEEFNTLLASEKKRYTQLAERIKETAELLNQLEVAGETNKEKLAAGRKTLETALKLIDPVLSRPVSDNNDQTK